MTVTISGIPVHYTRAGQGPGALFLHGWGVGHEVYCSLIDHAALGYTVYAPDLPGFGKTPEPPEPWGVEDYAAFVLQFCAALGVHPKAALGHSNGGRVLLQLTGAMDNALNLQKLVLLASAGLRPRRKPSYYVKVYAYKTAKILLKPFPALRERYQSARGSKDYRNASPLMRGTMSRLLGADLSPALPRVSVPTLLIWGQDDDAAPYRDALAMESVIPDAGLVTLPGGHWAFAEQWPITAAALTSFLSL
jgi:pimeloyl-ACP methyl ester carboxylesterase